MLTAMSKVPNRGVAFERGDDFIVVPPLTTGQIRDHKAAFRQILESTNPSVERTDEEIDAILDTKLNLTLLAVQRNYPDATIDDVRDLVTLENINDIISAILGVSREPKVKDMGEIKPVTSTS